MLPANPHCIYLATAKHADALRQLAEQSSSEPLAGRVLIGEIDGAPAAALSLLDGRIIADPSKNTDRLRATLRMRAGSLRAYEATPSLRERLRAAFAAYRGDAIVVPAWVWREGFADSELERRAA